MQNGRVNRHMRQDAATKRRSGHSEMPLSGEPPEVYNPNLENMEWHALTGEKSSEAAKSSRRIIAHTFHMLPTSAGSCHLDGSREDARRGKDEG